MRQHNLELSAAVSPNPQVAAVAYNPEILTATLDWIAIAANDYYGSSNKRTAYLLPLQTTSSSETGDFVSDVFALISTYCQYAYEFWYGYNFLYS